MAIHFTVFHVTETAFFPASLLLLIELRFTTLSAVDRPVTSFVNQMFTSALSSTPNTGCALPPGTLYCVSLKSLTKLSLRNHLISVQFLKPKNASLICVVYVKNP